MMPATDSTPTILARFSVPRLPEPYRKRGRWARTDWNGWWRAVRMFARFRGVQAATEPCRVIATVRWPAHQGIADPSDALLSGWRESIEQALMMAGIVPRTLLTGATITCERLPSWSAHGGVEIVITAAQREEERRTSRSHGARDRESRP